MAFRTKSALCLVAVFVVLLATTVSALYAKPSDIPLLGKSFVAETNSKAKGQWTASADNGHLVTGKSLEEVRKLMGVTSMSTEAVPPRNFSVEEMQQDLPESFDASEKWPMCVTIGEIRDQSNCGSCWAIAAVEAMSDRYCTMSGIPDRRISTTNLLSCCFICGFGCYGGIPAMAWLWWVWVGVTTELCQPYPFGPCSHHGNSSKYPPCPNTIYNTPKCNTTCDNVEMELVKYKGVSSYSIKGERELDHELMNNGPLEVAMQVYADFVAYKSGVYKHVSGDHLGGHAVKLVGWGVKDGIPYWKIANSWNTDWGDKGYFLIQRGNDECGIESSGVAGKPGEE
uniref:Cathepsin B-like enzyme n=1 Tax=Leishmania mexicana TaxID=5665 RepID=Q25319_LEIME|nr:cathepsin B-like enzyme [Leishmania mexicana]prf//2202319A cathepsin B-like Cys protease [Leishmania mexicana]